MKRHIFLCIILFHAGFLSNLGAQIIYCENDISNREVVIYYTNPKYYIQDSILPPMFNNQQIFQWINVQDEEFGIVDSVGMPCLPQITFNINLPVNAENITISMVDSTIKSEYLNEHIIPYQKDVSAEDTHSFLPFSFNDTCYKSYAFFYNQRTMLSNTYKIRDKLGVSVTLFPFEYSPMGFELRVLENAELVIRYDLNGTTSEAPASSVFEDYYSSFFKNYTPVTTNLTTPKYLIVTPKRFVDELQPFVDYKESIGYNVDVVCISPEERSSEAIKSIIQTRYNDFLVRPDYILLVGDSIDIPPAQGNPSGGDIDNPITDLPYVLLDGNDLEADAFVGRWPICSGQELHNIIHKTIYMEMNMSQLSKRGLFVSGDDDSWFFLTAMYMRWCFETAHEYAIEETFEPEGYSCEHRYQPYLNTVKNWMMWNPLVFAYSGHGGTFSMGPLYEDSYINGNAISVFQNETFPMVFSFACKTGNFAYTDANNSPNIAESWIRKSSGGVIFLGSSVNTLTISDIVIEKKIFGEAFFDANKRSIGKVIALGMRRFREHGLVTNNQGKRYTKSYNLMGDPSFLVRGLNCPPQYLLNGDNVVQGDSKEYHASERVVVGDGVTIGNECNLFLSAGDEIVFEDGFEAVWGAEVEAEIDGCDNRTFTKGCPTTTNGSDETNSFNLTNNSDSFLLYPNPTDNDVTIEFDADGANDVKLQIYSMQGRCVYNRTISIASVGRQLISIPLLNIVPSGYYIVGLSLGNHMFSKILLIR